MDGNTFLNQFPGEDGFCAIVPCHGLVKAEKISGQGAHSDTADSYKINMMYLFQIHK
jgi:hypothetical protein